MEEASLFLRRRPVPTEWTRLLGLVLGIPYENTVFYKKRSVCHYNDEGF